MRMRLLIVSVALLATPAAAQFNANTAINTSPGSEGYYVADPLSWSYAGQTNLQQRRAIIREIKGWCASDTARNQKRCANALQVIRAGYAELQLRRQAEQAVAD